MYVYTRTLLEHLHKILSVIYNFYVTTHHYAVRKINFPYNDIIISICNKTQKCQQPKFYFIWVTHFQTVCLNKIELEVMLPSCLGQWIVYFKLLELWQNTLFYTKNPIRKLGTVPELIMSFIPTAKTCFYTAAKFKYKFAEGIHWYFGCFKGLCTNSS